MDMAVTTYLCPYTEPCPFYKNWIEQGREGRVNVISKFGDGKYNCLVLTAIQDPATEGGIPIGENLRSKLSNSDRISLECSHIELLNLLNNLTKARL